MHESGDGGGSASFPETLSSSPDAGFTTSIDSSPHTSIDFGDSGRDWSSRRNASNSQGTTWLSLLATGILFVIFGIIVVTIVSASDINPYDPFAEQDRQFDDATNAIGGIMIFGGLVFIIVSFLAKNHEDSMAWRAMEESPEPPEPLQERRIIQEVIRVRCRYCGTLNEINSKHCTTCGAVL